MVVSYAHTIFNTNTNAAKVRRPPIITGNIDTTRSPFSSYCENGEIIIRHARFNSDALTSFQIVASGIARAIVDIKADVMAKVVWEKHIHRLVRVSDTTRCSYVKYNSSYAARELKSELLELILQSILSDAV